jgi:hypothetical protein
MSACLTHFLDIGRKLANLVVNVEDDGQPNYGLDNRRSVHPPSYSVGAWTLSVANQSEREAGH